MNRETAEPQVSDLPGERARRVVDFHHERAAPSTYVYEFVWDHSAPAIGPFCTDVDGNVLLDFTGHVGAMPLGYNNPKILDPLSEFDIVDPMKIAGQDFYLPATGALEDAGIPGPADLMERLTAISEQYEMDTVFLSNSGAEAVENALKISYDHTHGKYAITCEGAFHGRTLGTLSLNRSKEIYRRQFPEIPSVHDVPYCSDRNCSPESCDCGFFFDDTSSLRKMVGEGGYVNPDEVAALVMEPIQGEGGYRFPSEAFAGEVAAVTEEYDIPLVVDEVQSGLGRTGEWWGSDHYAFDPDVIASAKSARVGATLSREEVFPEEKSRLSSTWGAGDILSSAKGVLTIDAIEEHDLLANATERGRQMKELLRDADLGGVVDVRGKGLMLAVEFESKGIRDDVQEAAFSRGFLIMGCGTRTMRLLPPLDVTEREIELGADLFAESVRAVSGQN
ncbi:aminotransferase class III-fold pyridoxal phosphate-dependent enzyme [Halovenus sp. WSH3]|uniref:Aminotransferase class III-fold pyridoxal phosphate-dependent enzyme n=1 Tax=Halovenus carboxidivorans TaxID=2692199 RepID=A0A6B0TA43_9EURY|nr:aminotransferase class III-fold pyridoxal phosphate-dependent enzyme [Halovenus carboxidivorans]MXR52463.1 aminotransferase class III-fold pyridoxal phosphate-dependent enzyme [Halovenus carboxidivorans]